MLAFPWPFRVTFADPTRAVTLPADYDQPAHLRAPLPHIGGGTNDRYREASVRHGPRAFAEGVSRVMEQGRLLCLI